MVMKKSFDVPHEMREQACGKCGQIYKADWVYFGKQWRDTTNGMCGNCLATWRKEQKQKEDSDAQKAQLIEMQQRIIARRKDYRENKSKIPLYYQSKDFTKIDAKVKGNIKKILPECVRYADEYPLEYGEYIKTNKPYPSLFLASPAVWGVGKTHLACAVLHRILDRWQGKPERCPVYFTTEPDIYLRIQNTYSFSNQEREAKQSETDIIQELINIPLLVIDDIGKQKRSDMKFVQRTLYTIINGRYDMMKPTVFTANMSLEYLERYLGGNDGADPDRASFDRLVEMCKDHFWLLEGESQRGK